MKLDITPLFKDPIVFVNVPTKEDAIYLEEQILSYNQFYQVHLPSSFSSKKVGIFKKEVKQTMSEILDQDLSKDYKQYKDDLIEFLDIKQLLNRFPQSLSYYQRLKFAMMIHIANKKRNYLFQGCGYHHPVSKEFISVSSIESQLQFIDFIHLIHSSSLLNKDYKVIFITSMNKEEVMKYMISRQYLFNYQFYNFYNNELTIDDESFLESFDDMMNDLKNNTLDNYDLLIDHLKYLCDVSYYEQVIYLLENNESDLKMIYELTKRRDHLKEAYVNLSKTDRLFIESGKEQRLHAYYILSYKYSEDREVLNALKTLEEYNKVLKYDHLYMDMAQSALFFVNRNLRKGDLYNPYYLKIEDYYQKAMKLGNEDAENQLSLYHAFQGNQDLETRFKVMLDGIDEDCIVLDSLLISLELFVKEYENLYIYEQVINRLIPLSYRYAADGNPFYEEIEKYVLRFYYQMKLLGYEDADKEKDLYLFALKQSIQFNQMTTLLDQAIDHINDYSFDEFKDIILEVESMNDDLQYGSIYYELHEICLIRDKREKDHSYFYELSNKYLKKAAALGDKDALSKIQ